MNKRASGVFEVIASPSDYMIAIFLVKQPTLLLILKRNKTNLLQEIFATLTTNKLW